MNVDPNGHAWYNVLWDWANTIAGILNPISTMTALGAIVTSTFNGNWPGLVDDYNEEGLIRLIKMRYLLERQMC